MFNDAPTLLSKYGSSSSIVCEGRDPVTPSSDGLIRLTLSYVGAIGILQAAPISTSPEAAMACSMLLRSILSGDGVGSGRAPSKLHAMGACEGNKMPL